MRRGVTQAEFDTWSKEKQHAWVLRNWYDNPTALAAHHARTNPKCDAKHNPWRQGAFEALVRKHPDNWWEIHTTKGNKFSVGLGYANLVALGCLPGGLSTVAEKKNAVSHYLGISEDFGSGGNITPAHSEYVGKLRKRVDALLGIVRSPRHVRENPVPGTPRAPRKPSEYSGEHSKKLFLQAVLKQEGRCIYCHNKFMTIVENLDYGSKEQLRPEEEHLLPRSADGLTVSGNVYAACQICNAVKADFIFNGLTDERLVDLIHREWNHFQVIEGNFCSTCRRVF
jgi:hypothetical protein